MLFDKNRRRGVQATAKTIMIRDEVYGKPLPILSKISPL
jgi:hypothetical protein